LWHSTSLVRWIVSSPKDSPPQAEFPNSRAPVEASLREARSATSSPNSASELAQAHGLRGYDAVRLAAAQCVADEELVLVTGDIELAAAAKAVGIAVSITNA
jgi:hypothetical protein